MPLCLSPCESFSPAMLRSEPAALAPWLRFRLAKWILGAKVTPSDWTSTSGAQTKIEVGTDVGVLSLARGAANKLDLKYKLGPELSVELGASVPFALRRLLQPPRDPERVYLVGDDYHDVQHNDALGITRCFVAIDLYRLLDLPPTDLGQGAAGGVLLFGVKPELRANLTRLASYSRKLNALTLEQLPRTATYVPGLRSEWASPMRTSQVGVDARAILEEVELIFSSYPFRSMVFVGALDGAVNDHAIGYFGEIQNPTEEGPTNAYRAPAPALGTLTSMNPTVKKIASFALGEVGKDKKTIEKDLLGQAKGILDSKIKDPNLKKAVDFGLGEIGKDKKTIEKDLLGQVKGIVDSKIKDPNVKKAFDFGMGEIGKDKKTIEKDLLKEVSGDVQTKLDTVIKNPIEKKIVDFGLSHAGENLKQLKSDAVDELKDEGKTLGTQFLTDHKDQLMKYKYEAAAVAAIAIAGDKQVRNFAVQQLKDNAPSLAKTVFDAAGKKLSLPAPLTSFLDKNATAIVTGDWQSLAKSAISTELGSGAFGNQAAAIVLEKLTGQPVTSQALKILGAQGLKALLDKGPVVAAGKAGEAAVTGATEKAVSVKTATGAAQLSHSDFAASYDTVASPGLA